MSLKRYQIECVTEGAGVYTDYRSSPPTRCPNNVDHEVNLNNIIIVQEGTIDLVTLYQGGVDTKNQITVGFPFQPINAGPGVNTTIEMISSFNQAPQLFTFLPGPDNIGDSFSIIQMPGTPIGTTLTNTPIGSNQISIPLPTPLNPPVPSLAKSFLLTITDGVNTNSLSYCTDLDVENNIVSTKGVTTHAFAPGSQILMTIPKVMNIAITNTNSIVVGRSNIVGSTTYIGTVNRLIYTNNSASAKTASFFFELRV